MLIHDLCLRRENQDIDSLRSTNEKSMKVRSSLALRQRQGTSGQALVSQVTPNLGLSKGGSGQCWINWTRAKTKPTSGKLHKRIERITFQEKQRSIRKLLSLMKLKQSDHMILEKHKITTCFNQKKKS